MQAKGAEGRDRKMAVEKVCVLAAGELLWRGEGARGRSLWVGDEEGGRDCPGFKEFLEDDRWSGWMLGT